MEMIRKPPAILPSRLNLRVSDNAAYSGAVGGKHPQHRGCSVVTLDNFSSPPRCLYHSDLLVMGIALAQNKQGCENTLADKDAAFRMKMWRPSPMPCVSPML
jgi:hypothetical protein